MVLERIGCEGDPGERCLRILEVTPILMCWCFLARVVGVFDFRGWVWKFRRFVEEGRDCVVVEGSRWETVGKGVWELLSEEENEILGWI